MNDEAIVQAQRRLRHTLVGDRHLGAITGSSDLAAHLLLHLDDAQSCWQLTLGWLQRTFDADRVDGGFTSQGHGIYKPLAEAIREDTKIPSSVGVAIDAKETSVRSVLESRNAVLFESISDDRRFTLPLRAQLLSLNTQSKLAISLRDGDMPIGIICCDWARERNRWRYDQCEQISEFATNVLSPIFAIIHDEADEREVPAVQAAELPVKLTPAELKVARLVVQGMSYKEIARHLNRSFSTVDHSLRSIRDKLNARSTARMIAMLSALLHKHYS
ncbi:helix-turn-helix transcriptional regulator [Herbaspirillum autotrophicum]|uniref:helix-turn-helix transcriptional regulator n=1 Tax=Herbaspirillum autotrophicum TaxID=180195 RepID=UPI000A93A81C|nr:LuxR C-terminal-related transcriptional regulator [Herbaspirillum autotrophicum]